MFAFSIRQRLWGLAGCALLCGVLIVGLSVWRAGHLLEAARKQEVRQQVESAWSVLEHFHALEQAGLPRAEAQRQALEVVKRMRYGHDGYFWVNDLRPHMVMHPTKPDLDGKSLSDFKDPDGVFLFNEMVSQVRASGAGFVPYRWPKPGFDQPVPKISYVRGFEPWGWVVGSGLYLDDVAAALSAHAYALAGGALLMLVLVFAAAIWLVRSILHPLGQLSNSLEMIVQKSDLSQALQIDRRDEFGRVAQLFNAAIDNFRQAFAVVQRAADEVLRMTASLAGSAQRVAALVARQDQAVGRMHQAIDGMVRGIDQLAVSAQQAEVQVNASGKRSLEGEAIVQQALEQMRGIASRVQESARDIRALDDSARQISAIVGVINGIAEQTNLLALNAAIEAARAGEQGRGFAVVADEVRTLAVRTRSSTDEIGHMVSSIQEGSRFAVAGMEQGSARVEDGVERASAAGEAMQNIAALLSEVVNAVQLIVRALQEQRDYCRHTEESIEELVAVSRETSADMASFTETMHALEQLARQLDREVSAYRH